MKFATETKALLAFALFLSGCSNQGGQPDAIPAAPDGAASAVQDFPVKLGEPYKVGTATYTPEDAVLYDEVGFASWYGAELGGKPTANGEVFVASGVSAAHKTLPMPSYAEVTSLDTGRTILVRINDRGPFSEERLIDLSEGAARQLGIIDAGKAGVRVRRVNPPEQDRAALRAGFVAPARMDTPESLLRVLRDRLTKQQKPVVASPQPAIASEALRAADAKKAAAAPKPVKQASKPAQSSAPKPQTKATAPTTGGGYVVQIAAFASKASATALAKKLDAKVSPSADGKMHRVRFGPFANQSEAQDALDRVRKRGYPQATMLRD